MYPKEIQASTSLPKIQRLIKGNYAITPEDIEKEYLKWVSINEYLIFEYKEHLGKRRYMVSLCPKRGNPKYAYNVKRKFQELSLPFEYEKKQLFKNPTSQYNSELHTNVLFITLTFDTKLTDYKTAWQTIGKNWNKFLSNIKKRYGKIHVTRCFEAGENNYPHIHAFLYMPEQNFVTVHKYKDGKPVWRIPYKEHMIMAPYWHSFIDIQGMPYLSDGLKYLGKYITKSSDLSLKQTKTLSLTWAFRKRSFSIGHKFKKLIFDRYVANDLTHIIVIQTKPSQQNLNQEQLVDHRPEFLKIPSNKPMKQGDSNRKSLNNILGFEKFRMLGILGKDTLKKLGGVPKGEWNFGLNDMQHEYADYEFYKIKPEKSLDESEERIKQIKNPFAEPCGSFGQEQWRQVHDGMNAKQPKSPVSDEDSEWWETEGKFLC